LVVDQNGAGLLWHKFRGQWSGGIQAIADGKARGYARALIVCRRRKTLRANSEQFDGLVSGEATGWVANGLVGPRRAKRMVDAPCDPKRKDTAYAGGSTKGGEISGWRMQLARAFAGRNWKVSKRGGRGPVKVSRFH